MLRVGGACGNQFLTFDAEFKFAKIQNSYLEGGVGEVGAHGNQFPTYNAEFKFAKIQNSYVKGGVGEEGSWKPISNF